VYKTKIANAAIKSDILGFLVQRAVHRHVDFHKRIVTRSNLIRNLCISYYTRYTY